MPPLSETSFNQEKLRSSAMSPVEPLKKFCEALVELVHENPSQSPEGSFVLTGLVQAIGRGCDTILAELSKELRSAEHASDSLQGLMCSSLICLGGESEIVLQRLNRYRDQLARVIDGLNKLQEIARSNSTIGVSMISDAVVESPIRLVDGAKLEIGESTSLSSASIAEIDLAVGSKSDGAPSEAPSLFDDGAQSRSSDKQLGAPGNLFSDDSGSAAETSASKVAHDGSEQKGQTEFLFQQAEAYREEGNLAQAEHLYSEALRVDGAHFPSRLYRGRVRLLRGQADPAIEDFTEAIRRNAQESQVFCWRADAYHVVGRFVDAISDYTQALELRPNWELVKYNRAVAYRLAKQFGPALAELNELVQLRPAHGRLYLNRGLIFQAQGKLPRAITEFRTALRLLPASQEAFECLEAAELLLKESQVERRISSLPRRQDPVPTILASSRTDAPPRLGHDTFYVRCPGCDGETFIRWNKLQLGRVLECPHCKGNFTMNSSGDIYEIVRDSAGRWKSRAAMDAQRESRRNRRYQIIGGVAATVMVIAISFGTTIRIGNGSPAALPKLPEEFEARVELFTRAWLTGDARTMKRLTDPAHDRQFFPWQRQNEPPLKIKPESLNDEIVVEITKLPSTPPVSWVQTKIDGLKLEGTDHPIELRLAWEERAGKWFFQPTR